MLCLILAILCILVVPNVWAAHITTDVVSCTQTGTNTTSGDCTVAADANLAVVLVGLRDGGGAVSSVNSVTVEGQSASLISGCAAGTGNMRMEFWALVSPPTGAGVTIATDATGGTVDQMVVGLFTFKNAALTSTFGTCVTVATTAQNVDLNSIGSSTDDLAIMGVATNGNTTCAADATSPVSTEQYDAANGANMRACGYNEVGASPTLDMRVDLSANVIHAGVAVSIRHASARRGGVPILFP